LQSSIQTGSVSRNFKINALEESELEWRDETVRRDGRPAGSGFAAEYGLETLRGPFDSRRSTDLIRLTLPDQFGVFLKIIPNIVVHVVWETAEDITYGGRSEEYPIGF
jgi:hypothetical protein